jgi:hypothetical protein
MKIDGHCHCGQITFQSEGDPNTVTVCHCTDCQTLTGSAFRANIPAPAAQLRAPQRHAEELCEDGRKRQQTPPRLLR